MQDIAISDKLRVFLVNLDVALQRQRPSSLTEVQMMARKKQNTLLILTIEASPLGKDYRKHILSALLGRTVSSQNELDWWDKSDVLDALKAEEQNGFHILKEVTNHIVCNPSREPRSLFAGARTPRNMPYLQPED